MKNIWILAEADASKEELVIMEEPTGNEQAMTIQETGNNNTEESSQEQKAQQNPIMTFLPLILIFAVMYLFMFRGPKKKQQEHQKMVSSLSKNDRVRTIGGIFGTVLDVRDDEIILKVDESTNTKMRVSPQAIATVLSDKTE